MSQTLEYYNANAAQLSDRYESTSLDAFHLALQSHIARGGRILELGCGSGRDAARAIAAGFDVAAIDGSPALLEEAGRLHPELSGRLFYLQLPARLPFSDGDFAGFFSIACLMHFSVSEVVAILDELNRVVEAGGKGIISVPSSRSDIDNNGVDEHGRVFNVMAASAWQEIFSRCGFTSEAGAEESDSLGRPGVSWVSFVLEKAGGKGAILAP